MEMLQICGGTILTLRFVFLSCAYVSNVLNSFMPRNLKLYIYDYCTINDLSYIMLVVTCNP